MSDLRCYVCGKPVTGRIVLVAMSKDVDRVFILHPGRCLDVVGGDAEIRVQVQEKK